MNVATMNIEEFKMDTLRYDENGNFLNPRIVMIAPSGSGKSWIVRNVLQTLKDIPCGTVIAPTDKVTKFYDDFIHKSFINYDYKQTIIPKILARQKAIIEKNKERVKNNKKEIDPRAFFVMDDCMAQKHLWLKDPFILEIMNQGRHFQLTYILTMQYCMGIQPELRTQFNFIFLLGEDNAASRKKIYEHWAGAFSKFELFEQVFQQVTQDYGCLVINNRIKSQDITKKIFWYRAKPVDKPFKIGSPSYLKFHNDNFDEDYEKNNFHPMLFGTNKKQSNVRVKLIK